MSSIEETYRQRYVRYLLPTAQTLENYIRDHLASCARVDRISARAKSVSRFIEKAAKKENGQAKYNDPLNEIQDQLGARIVTFYLSDVPCIADEVKKYFFPLEDRLVVPEADSEFGYFGQHFILLIPSDIRATKEIDAPMVFELQIKTLFQHAWSEAEHDLGYKTVKSLSSLQKRKIAFTAAQAWGADQIFDELFKELNSTQQLK